MSGKKVAFIVDSSIGIFDKDLTDKNIRQVFFGITDSKGKVYQDDNSELTNEVIMQRIEDGEIFKTSAVSPGPVMMITEELMETNDHVILFTVSSGISSFHDNIKFLEEEYKNRFHVVDTKEVGYAIQQMILKARKMLDDNEPIEKVLDFCKTYYLNDFTFFTCSSWTPLVKGGRAPAALSKIFNALKTRPVINFYIKNSLAGISRSFESSFERMIKTFKKLFNNPTANDIEYFVFYNNGIEEDKAQYIRDKVKSLFGLPTQKFIETIVPNLVLIYTAKGSFGIHVRCLKNKRKEKEEE